MRCLLGLHDLPFAPPGVLGPNQKCSRCGEEFWRSFLTGGWVSEKEMQRRVYQVKSDSTNQT